jgi:hypothetical protein
MKFSAVMFACSLAFLPAGLAHASNVETKRALPRVETVSLDDARMTYEIYETSIEHADLSGCPEGIDEARHFCRLTLAAERAHVFVFALDGDQPLVAVHSYDLDAGLPGF